MTSSILVAILIKVMLLITANPDIPQDVKDSVVAQVMVVISEEALAKPVVATGVVQATPVPVVSVEQTVIASSTIPMQAEIYRKSKNVLDFKMNDADRVEYVVSWNPTGRTIGYAIPVGGDNTIEVKDGDTGRVEVVSFKNKQEIGRFTKELSEI